MILGVPIYYILCPYQGTNEFCLLMLDTLTNVHIKSNIYQHISQCLEKYSKDFFSFLKTTSTKHQLQIKELLHST